MTSNEEKEKRAETFRKAGRKREEILNEIAQGLGFDTWRKLGTAAKNGEIIVSIEWVGKEEGEVTAGNQV